MPAANPGHSREVKLRRLLGKVSPVGRVERAMDPGQPTAQPLLQPTVEERSVARRLRVEMIVDPFDWVMVWHSLSFVHHCPL